MNRGIRCDPDCIAVVSGTQHGLRLCADARLSPGDRLWVEDPGYPAARGTLAAAGLDLALIDWATATGSWIFEDDYDSEFRYSGPSLTALAGLSPDRVIYLGTFTKTLFAGLRLGYLVAPPDALVRILQARAAIDRFPPAFMQDALADLMVDGTVTTHLRRNLRRYRAARDRVAQIIAAQAGGVLIPDVPDHGLHMIAWLRAGLSPDLADAIRHEAGVETLLFSQTRLLPPGRDGFGAEGFVIGFSGHDPDALSAAATALARAAQRLARA